MKKITACYVRVSTLEQIGGMESQTRALTDWCAKNGVTTFEFFTDHGISGAKENRPALNRLMQRVENGEIDQVVVFSFSRFARSTTHLLKGLSKFREKSVRFHSITEALDTNSPMGLALFTILGCLSQLERELIRERVVAGLKNAKAKGVKLGREKKRDSHMIRALLKKGLTFRAIGELVGSSHGSVYAEKLAMLKDEREAELAKKLAIEGSAAATLGVVPTVPAPGVLALDPKASLSLTVIK